MKPRLIIGTRTTAMFWALSGAFFVSYPMMRPFSTERGMNGAQAFASPWWSAAHLSAIAAFACLIVAATGTYSTAPVRPALARIAWLLQTVGLCLVLPFYGAEAYGLRAIGRAAIGLTGAKAAFLVGLSSDVRGGVGLVVFVAGAVAFAVGGVVSVGATLPMTFRRWGAIVIGAAELLFVPQFFFDQPWRVAHGALFLLGAALYAAAMSREQITWSGGTAMQPEPTSVTNET